MALEGIQSRRICEFRVAELRRVDRAPRGDSHGRVCVQRPPRQLSAGVHADLCATFVRSNIVASTLQNAELCIDSMSSVL